MQYLEQPPIDCITIGPGRIAEWQMPAHWYAHGRSHSSKAVKPRQENPVAAAQRSRKRLMDASGWLWLRSKGRYIQTADGREVYFRQAFWTLTLPESAPERNARLALSRLWTWARNRAGLESYVWTAELTAMGRVHFHALVNDWVSMDRLRLAWMRCLEAEGCLRNSYERPPAALVKMERIKSAAQARQYCAKYVAKALTQDRAGELREAVDLIKSRLTILPIQDSEESEALTKRLWEAEARLEEAGKRIRRWGSSTDVIRPAVTLNAADDPKYCREIGAELRSIDCRWMPPGEHGRAGYFDLGAVDKVRTPLLSSLLHDAAGIGPNRRR